MLYRAGLEDWLIFLETGKRNSYCDLEVSIEFTIEELVEKISNFH